MRNVSSFWNHQFSYGIYKQDQSIELDQMYLLSAKNRESIIAASSLIITVTVCGSPAKYPVEPSNVVSVWEREQERDREKQRQRDREKEKESIVFAWYPFVTVNYTCTQKNGMAVKLDAILKIYGHGKLWHENMLNAHTSIHIPYMCHWMKSTVNVLLLCSVYVSGIE